MNHHLTLATSRMPRLMTSTVKDQRSSDVDDEEEWEDDNVYFRHPMSATR